MKRAGVIVSVLAAVILMVGSAASFGSISEASSPGTLTTLGSTLVAAGLGIGIIGMLLVVVARQHRSR